MDATRIRQEIQRLKALSEKLDKYRTNYWSASNLIIDSTQRLWASQIAKYEAMLNDDEWLDHRFLDSK